jgi:hypothetical protein
MTKASIVICAHALDRWDELKCAVGSVRIQTRAPPKWWWRDNIEALRERCAREIAGVTVLANVRQPGLSGGRMTGLRRNLPATWMVFKAATHRPRERNQP